MYVISLIIGAGQHVLTMKKPEAWEGGAKKRDLNKDLREAREYRESVRRQTNNVVKCQKFIRRWLGKRQGITAVRIDFEKKIGDLVKLKSFLVSSNTTRSFSAPLQLTIQLIRQLLFFYQGLAGDLSNLETLCEVILIPTLSSNQVSAREE